MTGKFIGLVCTSNDFYVSLWQDVADPNSTLNLVRF